MSMNNLAMVLRIAKMDKPSSQISHPQHATGEQCATVPGRGPSAHGPGRQAFEARPALQAREARATGPRGLRLSQL
jgi:hypothetical protein